MNKLCTYDGVTLLIKDPATIQRILNDPGRYKLKGFYDVESGISLGVKGRFKNFDLITGGNKRGKGIYLGGSIHKFKNGTHNADQFYWHEFEQAVTQLVEEFRFDLTKVDVCALESGFNISMPKEWNCDARTFAANILRLKGRAGLKRKEGFPKDGLLFELKRGEYTYKSYDKGRHYQTGEELLRVEKRFLKGRTLTKFSIRTMADLVLFEKHQLICDDALMSFKDMVIFQPELLENPNLNQNEREFLYQFKLDNDFIRKNETTYASKKKLREYDRLLNKYCNYNLRDEVIRSMGVMLM